MALSAAEKAELASLQGEVSGGVPEQVAPSSKLSKEEAAELASLQGEVSVPDGSVTGTKGAALKGLAGLGKLGSVLYGTTTGPALATILEGLTGKKLYSGSDVANSVNPTNLKSFPTVDELLARSGVPKGASLSDVVPGYSNPGSPWYKPEKGGMLDPSARGAGAGIVQALIDPGTYLTLGESTLAKGAADSASKRVLQAAARQAESPATRALLALPRAGQALAETAAGPGKAVAGAVRSVPYVGRVAPAVLDPVGTALSGVGKALYGSPLLPVEQMGERFNKSDVANDLYNAGIKTPYGLNTKAKEAMGTLGRAKEGIENAADRQGASISMQTAVAPAEAEIRRLKDLKTTGLTSIAEAMGEQGKDWLQTERGSPAIPGTPARTVQEASSLLDASGNPYMNSRVIPGSPGVEAIPPSPYSTRQAAGIKTELGKVGGLPESKYMQGASTSTGQKIHKEYVRGLKNATEEAIDAALGSGQGTVNYADINRAYGGLASTREAQRTVGNRADRQLGQMLEASPADVVTATGGAIADGGKGAAIALASKKLGTLWKSGAMPTGYGLRSLGEDPLTDILMTSYAKNRLRDVKPPRSPWLEGTDNEK